MKKFDAAIIGGGPAGSFTGLLLASAGLSVCLFEKKKFPRETLCGEFLSYEVSNHLKTQGMFEKFLLLDPNKITSFALFTSGGEKLKAELKFTAFGLKRSVFDKFLLEEAVKRGVIVYQPVEAGFIPISQGYIVKSKTGDLVSSSFLIGAYGKKNDLDKQLNRKFNNEETGFNGVKIHLNKNMLRGFCSNEIHLYTGKNIYCGINAVNEDDVTLCFLEKRKKGDPPVKEKLLLLRRQNKYFDKVLCDEADEAVMNAKVYGTGNIYFGRKSPVDENIFMAGDAAGIIAPLAGDGIGMALESSALLAEAFTKSKDHKSAARIYRGEWNHKFRRRIKTSGFLQYIVFSAPLLSTGVKLCRRFPRLTSVLIDYTRK